MNELDTIKLYRGATSDVEFDFTGFNFVGNNKCVFTMKPLYNDEIIKQFEFTEPKVYNEVFTDEFTATLEDSEYRYDIMYMVGEERYPQCLPSKIEVSEVVNEYTENQSE